MWSVINRLVVQKNVPHIQLPIHYCMKSASKVEGFVYIFQNLQFCRLHHWFCQWSIFVYCYFIISSSQSNRSYTDITNFTFHLDINFTSIMLLFVYRAAVNKYFYVDDMWDIVNLNNSLGIFKKLQRNLVSKYNWARLVYQQAMSPHIIFIET